MKSLFLYLCLSICLQVCIAQPKIFFPETMRYFGDIEPNSDGRRHFVFTNIGDEPLVIKQCKTSCGCLVGSWPRDSILFGEWPIQLRYDAKNRKVEI